MHSVNAPQLILGDRLLRALVGEYDSCGTHTEEGVGDQHATVVPRVPVLCDVFRAHDQCIPTALHLQSLCTLDERQLVLRSVKLIIAMTSA